MQKAAKCSICVLQVKHKMSKKYQNMCTCHDLRSTIGKDTLLVKDVIHLQT